MNVFRYLKIAAVAVPVVLSACRGRRSKKPPIHPILNMDFQNRFEAQEENPFFADDRSMRQPVKGTVPRNGLHLNKALYQGINPDSSFVKHNPIKLTKKFLFRGQDRFNVFCSPCHGLKGDGKGIIMTNGYGFVPAPTYHQQRLRNVNDGYIYSVITNGIRTMQSYAHQIPVRDRWAIVAYVRALQKSRNVPESEMQKYNVDLASLNAKARQKMEEEQTATTAQQPSGGAAEITAAKGKELAQQNACSTCHSTDGSKMTGPTWKNLYGHKVELQSGKTVTADEAYIKESIVNSTAKITKGFQPVMPNFSFLSENDVKSLIAYIKSLSSAAPAENSESEPQKNTSGKPAADTTNTTSNTTSADTTTNTTSNQQQQATPGNTVKTTASADTTDTTGINKQLSPSALQGKKLIQEYECLSCHTIDGSKELAPPFKGIFGSKIKLADGSTVTADEGYIKESMQYPGAKLVEGYNANMPSYRDLMSDQDLQAITDYIKSLQ